MLFTECALHLWWSKVTLGLNLHPIWWACHVRYDNEIINYVFFSPQDKGQCVCVCVCNHFDLLPHPPCSPAWSVCERTSTPRPPRALAASWRPWWSGRRTSLIRPTPATSSGRPSSVCASWRARKPSSWCKPGPRRYVERARWHRC